MRTRAKITDSKIYATTALFVLLAIICSCSKNKDKENSTPNSVDGSQKTANQSTTKQMESTLPSQIQHISDNPNFYQVGEITPTGLQGKDIDSFIRPFLEKHFGAAKLVSQAEKLSDQEKNFGEDDIIDSITYVVRKLFTKDDMVAFHSDVISSTGFATSPRYGAKPQGRSIIMMSIFKSTSKGSYSLGIIARTKEQTILIESHKLGSKYDSLM